MVDVEISAHRPLGYLLYRVASALRAEVVATALEPLDLAFPEYICMRMLSQTPGRSNAELARDTHVSPQAMNKVVRRLQERGLVTRSNTAPSGRSLPTTLTSKGVAILEGIDPKVLEAEGRVLAKLGEQDRREFLRLLTALG
jgi:DNA-binding MarR family transcriptional regulator